MRSTDRSAQLVAAQPRPARPARRSRARTAPGAPGGLGGGLLAIGGPPLGGKSVLAAALADLLPHSIRLEAVDDLSRATPYWIPDDPGARAVARPARHLLAQAKEIWRSSAPSRRPTVIVVTRFGTAAERRRAKVHARLAGMPFLFVEALSRDAQALRRVPAGVLDPRDLELRLARYDEALRRYAAMRRSEALILPGVTVRRVNSDLDAALARVLAVWSGR